MASAVWVDSHCHLFMLEGDPGAALDAAGDQGVSWIMAPGTDLETTLEARNLASQFPDRVEWSAGLHPHDASLWPDQGGRLSSLAAEAAAIGETGLDYYRNLSPREAQQASFAAQLDLATRLQKPIVVHCRDAFADVYEALEDAALGERAVLHCWTGGPRWTKRFRDLGATFSFAGPVAFETGDTVRRGAAEAPPHRTMVETDTPFLTPPPYRGQNNQPANVPLIGAALAEVWGVSSDDVAEWTTATANRVFGREGS
jgi:TatD DNase family protein